MAFFAWLVGPMELEQDDVTFEGRQEQWRSKVQIKKCRYLEQSGCVGMCVNMCKVGLGFSDGCCVGAGSIAAWQLPVMMQAYMPACTEAPESHARWPCLQALRLSAPPLLCVEEWGAILQPSEGSA